MFVRKNAIALAALTAMGNLCISAADPDPEVAGAGPATGEFEKEKKPAAAKKAAKKKTVAKVAKKAAKKKVAAKKAGDAKGPQVLRAYAPEYHHDKEKKTSSGNVSVDCNDELAAKLRGKDLEAVYALAAKTLGEPESDLRKKYKHLNVGMQRMNLGNRIRGVLNAK